MCNKRKNSDSRYPDLSPLLIFVGFFIILNFVFGCTSGVTPTSPTECAPNAIPISIMYSSEVDYYLPAIMSDFNKLSASAGLNPDTNTPLTVAGKPICVTGKPVSAGSVRAGIINAITAPNNQNGLRPTIWSPSASTWLLLTNRDLGREIFDPNEPNPTALAPVVIAIWQSRLDAIRNKVGYDDIGWEELLALLTSPNGWCDYGIPNCRPAVYYGHTNPFNSPTGFSTLISEFYASARANTFTDRTLNLDAVNRSDIQQGVRDTEKLIRHYSDRTTEFKFYIAQGPDYVDFVALEENDVISINQGHDPLGTPIPKPPEPLVALYPKEGTFIHDHPFGIVNADWVTPEQHDAALVFRDYVLTKQVQTFIMSKGFRPANSAVQTSFPIDPVNGVNPTYPKTLLDMPDIDTLQAIQQSWGYVKKKADVTLLIDISGSMNQDDKLTQAKTAAQAFLDKTQNDPMQHDNRVGLTVFNDNVRQLVPVASLETNEEALRREINALTANGETALYDALVTTINALPQTDCRNHIRAIILLSDGADTNSSRAMRKTVEDAIATTLNTTCPILVIVVAYGSDADMQTLNAIARSAKTQVQIGDPNNIGKVLDVIRGYF